MKLYFRRQQKLISVLWVIPALTLFYFANTVRGDSTFETLANPSQKKDFVVDRVVRADIILLDNGKKYRLIGLNAPDAPKSKVVKRDNYGIVIEEQTPTSTLSEKAYDFARRLLENKRVRLEFDSENKDENFYTYVYAFLDDGTLANVEILRHGYANLKITPTNTKYADRLRQAYRDARSERIGIHGE